MKNLEKSCVAGRDNYTTIPKTLKEETDTIEPSHFFEQATSIIKVSPTNSPDIPVDIEEARRVKFQEDDPYPPPIKVPRSQRRGFLGRFTFLAEVENSIHYSRKTKWLITLVVSLCGIAAPMASSIILPALTPITNEFNTTPFIANLSISFYTLAMAIFPLWWSVFSENFGRRTIFIVSYIGFILFAVLCAVSSSIGMFITMRLLNGGASASAQVIGVGAISDIWESKERGKAMGYFYLGPLCGPLIAPIIGGALAETLGWRSTMWFLAIYGTVILILIVSVLPETIKNAKEPSAEASIEFPNVESSPQELRSMFPLHLAEQKDKAYLSWFRMVIIDPFRIIGLMRFPAIAFTVYYASVTFASLALMNISLQSTFSKPPYNFSTFITGFTYSPGSVGFLVASLFGGVWMDRIMRREAIKAQRHDGEGRLVYHPEDRMQENAWIGAIMYSLALIWYGWTAERGVFWVGTLMAPFFFGVGTTLIFAVSTTMLTEFVPHKSSSGVALNNFMRNICSCVGSLVAAPLLSILGNGYLFTIVGTWCLLSMSVIWAIRHFGPRWRLSMEQNIT